jgi:hypothetical protein
VEERWEGLERIIRSAPKKALKDWYDAECGKKKKSKKEIFATQNRANQKKQQEKQKAMQREKKDKS